MTVTRNVMETFISCERKSAKHDSIKGGWSSSVCSKCNYPVFVEEKHMLIWRNTGALVICCGCSGRAVGEVFKSELSKMVNVENIKIEYARRKKEYLKRFYMTAGLMVVAMVAIRIIASAIFPSFNALEGQGGIAIALFMKQYRFSQGQVCMIPVPPRTGTVSIVSKNAESLLRLPC